jgi:hypothetical protein
MKKSSAMYTANPKIIHMHSRPGGALIETHQFLALLKSPQRRRKSSDVHSLRGNVKEVRQQPTNFTIKNADLLTTFGDLNTQGLFGRQYEGMLLIHRSDVIEPVEISDCPQIGLVLDQFLSAAMEKAYVQRPRRRVPAQACNTPCAAGCCGPKLIAKFRSGIFATTTQR